MKNIPEREHAEQAVQNIASLPVKSTMPVSAPAPLPVPTVAEPPVKITTKPEFEAPKQQERKKETGKRTQPDISAPEKVIKRRVEEDSDDFVPLSTIDSFEGYGLTAKYDKEWHSTREQHPLVVPLNDFGLSSTNSCVVAIRIVVPSESSRWSINICPPAHHNQQNILLHFNPRYKKRSELILNDKVGTWGAADKSFRDGHQVLRQGEEETLVIIIRKEGFYIFGNSKTLIAAFAHRRRISSFRYLQCR
jgi:hypothetical protein